MITNQPTATDHYVIGTRASPLALRQVELVRALLLRAYPTAQLEVRHISTEGDRTSAPLSAIGGLGVFTKAIEDALLTHEIDIAVHSLKDLPPLLAPGLMLAAIPQRADARDALVAREGATLADLPSGARVGTGSERRAVQLRALRPDLRTEQIRGNVETRIRKVQQGEYDAAVLALAGLQRLGIESNATTIFTIEEMLPAAGQAALAVEVRTDDERTRSLVAGIDHAETRAAVEAERAYLARLGAGCRMPVGAYAVVRDGKLHLEAMLAAGDARPERERASIAWSTRIALEDVHALGARLADAMLAKTV